MVRLGRVPSFHGFLFPSLLWRVREGVMVIISLQSQRPPRDEHGYSLVEILPGSYSYLTRIQDRCA